MTQAMKFWTIMFKFLTPYGELVRASWPWRSGLVISSPGRDIESHQGICRVVAFLRKNWLQLLLSLGNYAERFPSITWSNKKNLIEYLIRPQVDTFDFDGRVVDDHPVVQIPARVEKHCVILCCFRKSRIL
jgi:hypothetical protein